MTARQPCGEHAASAMPADQARETQAMSLVHALYGGQIDDNAIPMSDHMWQVAQRCPGNARVIAWLHDVVEDGLMSLDALCDAMALSQIEREALTLLTRPPGTHYDDYIEAIATSSGPAGSLARVIKRADLEANLARPHNARRAHLRVRYESALNRMSPQSGP